MSADISNFVLELFRWQNISAFLNSNFTAALAGAFAGAMAAQRIGDRAKQRDILLREIRSTNAAIIVSFTVCNAGLGLKKQFVKEIYETYMAKKADLEEFHRRRSAGQVAANQPFEFQADFRTLQMPQVPIDILRTQVYENISATGRPLALVGALSGAADSLADTIQKRNALIQQFLPLGAAGEAQLPAFYFGLPYGHGHLSTEFSDTVESLYTLTDDVIFFSELLGKDLMEHGNGILNQYRKIAKVKKEKISELDFAEPRSEGLMPDAKNYTDWLRAFPNSAQQGAPADAEKRRG